MVERRPGARLHTAGLITCAALFLIGCTDPVVLPVVEPTEPADILIINASVTGLGPDSATVVTRLRNLGRSGTAKLQAWGSHVNPDSADVLLGETAPTEVRANAFPELTWKVAPRTPKSASGIGYVTAATRDEDDSPFRQTSRWNFR